MVGFDKYFSLKYVLKIPFAKTILPKAVLGMNGLHGFILRQSFLTPADKIN